MEGNAWFTQLLLMLEEENEWTWLSHTQNIILHIKISHEKLSGKDEPEDLNDIIFWVFLGIFQIFLNLTSSVYYVFPIFKLHDNSYVSLVNI